MLSDPNIIVGMEKPDDAGVYRLSDELAIIQTVDFMTPIVDDPYTFGQIAATNSLSDVYAMGGKPLTAMNIVCFPIKLMDIAVLREMLRGGLDKIRDAGAVLIGGHSVDDNELKYGLSVTGTANPQKILLRSGARPGDLLILTKPLGTGILSTALKGGVLGPEDLQEAVRNMTLLNRDAAEIMSLIGAHACTDITGFGLLGHAAEMCLASDVGMRLEVAAIPVLPGVVDLAKKGVVPGGLQRNRDFRLAMVHTGGVPDWMVNVLFDPQTSGGLFISAAPARAREILEELRTRGHKTAAIVGMVTAEPKGKIILE